MVIIVNQADYVEEQIKRIDEKVDLIEEQIEIVNGIVPYFSQMGDFYETLKSIYDEFSESLDFTLFRIRKLNRIVLDRFFNGYEVIFNNLHNDCLNVLSDLSSINFSSELPKLDE